MEQNKTILIITVFIIVTTFQRAGTGGGQNNEYKAPTETDGRGEERETTAAYTTDVKARAFLAAAEIDPSGDRAAAGVLYTVNRSSGG